MKVGIITIQKSPNYGACLQCYGLYSYLTSIGYECEVIDLLRPTHKNFIPSHKFIPYRTKKTSLLIKIKKTILHLIQNNTRKKFLTAKAQNRFNHFNSTIKYSKPYQCIDDLYRTPPSYDVYISGSDQLWNPTIGFCIEPYFLTFVKNGGLKISYATSVGISGLSNKEKSDFSNWLKHYAAISVREKSACNTLKELTSQKIEQECDPSFLLTSEEWEKLQINPSLSKSYILLFTLNYCLPLLELAQRLKEESGKELVYLCLYHPETDKTNYIIENSAGPREFLGYIANAEMVITNSFHGTVFSLILGANNFYSYIPSTQKRGQRISDLLDCYGLSDHILKDDFSIDYVSLASRKLNYNRIRDVMDKERMRGRYFLKKNIGNDCSEDCMSE